MAQESDKYLTRKLLPDNSGTIDRQKKMSLYEKHGVKEYWIVDPSEIAIEQYLFKDNTWQLQVKANMSQNLSAVVIEDLTFPEHKIFG